MAFELRGTPIGLVMLARYPSRRRSKLHTAVLLSKQIECWVIPTGEGVELWVREEKREAAGRELSLYESEQWREVMRPRPEAPPTHGEGWLVQALVWTWMIGCFAYQQEEGSQLTERWLRSSAAIFDRGEWWRCLTALFLHADAPHLMINVILGAVFSVWTARTFGPIFSWVLVLAAGSLANAVTAALVGADSLGFSTGVFAMTGLLTGHGLHYSWRNVREHKSWLMPLGGGFALLGSFGAADRADVDVAAHLFGFLCGLPLGVVGSIVERWRSRGVELRRETLG